MRDATFLLVSLRPIGGHDGLRRAASRRGGRVVAISPWRILVHADADARRQLRNALTCPCVIFTSPAAVRTATRLQSLKAKRGQHFFGVGEGTRRALWRAGVQEAQAPARMDSEGLLAMPAIAGLRRGDRIGLVTAPGGRGEIPRQLRARGVHVVRTEVYARTPVTIPQSRWHRLQQALDDAVSPIFLALSSGDALLEVLAQTPSPLSEPLRKVTVIAASERLASLARESGFHRITVAASARPQDMLDALADTP